MQAATYQARQAVRRVETYAMVHELALDIIHEAETKALQTRVQEHALASRSLQDTVRELRQKQSNLQLKYAEFVKQSEKLRFDLETQLWCAAREIELKKQLEQVSEKLRQRVMEQHNSIKSINEQVEDQRRQLEAQERRIRQQKPSGEQLWFHLPAKVVVNVLHFLPRAAWVSLAATNSCMYARLDAIIVKHFPRGIRIRGYDSPRNLQSPPSGLGSGLALDTMQANSRQRRHVTPTSSPRVRNNHDTDSVSEHSGDIDQHHHYYQQRPATTPRKRVSGSGLFGVSKTQGIDAKEANRWLSHIRQLDSELAKAKARIEDLEQKLKTIEQVKKYLVDQRDAMEAEARKAKEEADTAKEQTKSDRQVLKLLHTKHEEMEKALTESQAQCDSYKQQLEDLNTQFEKEIRSQRSAASDDDVQQLKTEVSRLKFQLRNRDTELNETIQQRDYYKHAHENSSKLLQEQKQNENATEKVKTLEKQTQRLVKEIKRLRGILEENGLGAYIKSAKRSGDVDSDEGSEKKGSRENGSSTPSKGKNPFVSPPAAKKGTNPFG